MNKGWWALGGTALGAGWMYLADPFSGRRRRAIVQDKVVHAGHEAELAVNMVAKDMAHRSRGLFLRNLARLRHEEVDNPTLDARVRSALGRVCSHPGAIRVTTCDGYVKLDGVILASELRRTLHFLRRVSGVRSLEQTLEVHDEPGRHPDLQGGLPRQGGRPEFLQRNWAPSARFFGGLGAAGLVTWGLARGGLVGRLAAAGGVMLGLRSATNLELRRLTGVGAGRHAIQLHKDLTVNAPVEDVFAFWRAMENFPRFMSHVKALHVSPEGRIHWKVEGPVGTSFAWDAEITRLVPNKLLAWRSLRGASVGNAGAIHFEPARDGHATRLDIRLSYNPPAGAVGHAFARMLGMDPKRQMDEDLLRFKTLVELGRATAHGELVTREQLTAPPVPAPAEPT